MKQIFSLIITFIFSISVIFANDRSQHYDLLWRDLKNHRTIGYKGSIEYDKKFSYIEYYSYQGIIQQSTSKTDLAIIGLGFFKVYDSKKDKFLYTRSGCFKINSEGYLVTEEGFFLYQKLKLGVIKLNLVHLK